QLMPVENRCHSSRRKARSASPMWFRCALAQGASGVFGPDTATTIVKIQNFHNFKPDGGVAGREGLGALGLMLRVPAPGWDPPPGAHWGGLLAKATAPLAVLKVARAVVALLGVQNLFGKGGAFDAANANPVTMAALKAHFKLVPPG